MPRIITTVFACILLSLIAPVVYAASSDTCDGVGGRCMTGVCSQFGNKGALDCYTGTVCCTDTCQAPASCTDDSCPMDNITFGICPGTQVCCNATATNPSCSSVGGTCISESSFCSGTVNSNASGCSISQKCCIPSAVVVTCASLSGYKCAASCTTPRDDATGCGTAQHCCPNSELPYCDLGVNQCQTLTCQTGSAFVASNCATGTLCCPKSTSKTCAQLSGECNMINCTRSMVASDCSDCCVGEGEPSPYQYNKYVGPTITNLAGLLSPIIRILFYAGLTLGGAFIIYAGYLLMTSEGDPQKTKEGQEQLTAAILGTLFIVLALYILRVIIGLVTGSSPGF